MMQRSLGALRVGAVGLGCMGLSDFYGSLPPPGFDASDAVACIQRAIDLGVTLLDTADIYAYGDNEELVGRAIAGRRESVVVSSKFGILRRKEDPEWRGVNAHPSYAQSACEASLRRLRCDHIDVYLLHRPDPRVPIEETMQALGALVHEGKVRYVGLSNASPDLLRRAHAVHPIAAIQNEYSLWQRDPERELLALCSGLGVGFVASSPLGRGFLSGALHALSDLSAQDVRRNLPRFRPGVFDANMVVARSVVSIAAAKGATPAQIALSWLLSREEAVVPIPGTRNQARLTDNCRSADLYLTREELAILDEASQALDDLLFDQA